MLLTEESEEQQIDRVLQEMGIRLPDIELAGEDPLPTNTETIPLFVEINDWLFPPSAS